VASRQASLLANPFPAPSRPGECCILHQINQDLLGWCWVEAERITVPFKGDVVGTTRWDEVSSRGRSARRKVPTADGPLPGRGPSFVVWSPWACGAYGQPSSHQRVSSLCSAAPLLPGRNPDLGACPCMLPTGRNPNVPLREGRDGSANDFDYRAMQSGRPLSLARHAATAPPGPGSNTKKARLGCRSIAA